MASSRIKGKALSLKAGSVEFAGDVLSVNLSGAEMSNMTFGEVAVGGSQDWTIEVEAIASTASGSFWSYLWDTHGTASAALVSFTIAPHGNTTASAGLPLFTGTARLNGKPNVEVKVNENSSFKYVLDVIGDPTKT